MTSTSIKLLDYLCGVCDNNGIVFTTNREIMEGCGILSTTTVKNCLDMLESDGSIEIVTRKRGSKTVIRVINKSNGGINKDEAIRLNDRIDKAANVIKGISQYNKERYNEIVEWFNSLDGRIKEIEDKLGIRLTSSQPED